MPPTLLQVCRLSEAVARGGSIDLFGGTGIPDQGVGRAHSAVQQRQRFAHLIWAEAALEF
jgi:hypothetical protein